MEANWHPDPTGRFGQRFHDGRAWTDHVIGANGQTSADPLTREYPPPPPWGASAAGGPGPVGRSVDTGLAPPGSRATSWYGVAIAGVGVLLTLLSLFVLDWADRLSASDIRDGLPGSLPDGLDIEDVISFRYVQWGGLVLALACLAGLAAVAAGIRGRDGDGPRLLTAVVAGVGSLFHAFAVVRLFAGDGSDPALGAWLGVLGFLAVAVGCAIATPKTRRATA